MVRVTNLLKDCLHLFFLVYRMLTVLKLTVNQIVQRKSEMYQITKKKSAKLFLPFSATGNESSFTYYIS